MTAGKVGYAGDRIEAAGVHLARRRDDDRRRSLQAEQCVFERGQIDGASRIVAQQLDDLVADAEHAEGLFRRGMDEATGHDRYRWQSAHSTLSDVGPVLFSP